MTAMEWRPGLWNLFGWGKGLRLPAGIPDSCSSQGIHKIAIFFGFRALGDKGIAILLKPWWCLWNIIGNGFLTAIQLLEIFGLTGFTATNEFLSILSERSFNYKFKNLNEFLKVNIKGMIKTMILESYNWDKFEIRLCWKDIIQEEQVLVNKVKTEMKMDFKTIGYENGMEKMLHWATKETIWCPNS